MSYFLILLSVASAAAAQLCMKKAAALQIFSQGWLLWLSTAVLSYGLAFLLYALLMKQFQLNRLSPVMAIATTAMVVAFATWLFQEPFTPRMALGMGLGMASICCLLW